MCELHNTDYLHGARWTPAVQANYKTKKKMRRRKDQDQAPEANYKTLARKDMYLAFKADGLGDWQEPLDKEEKLKESVII